MKKIFAVFMIGALMAVMTACGNSEENDAASAEETPVEETPAEETSADQSVLVVYYSATGSTKSVAEIIAEKTGGELFELEPVEPYTDEDLDYNDDGSRVSREHDDESLRNIELTADTVENWQNIETVYIGYPKMEYSL